MADLLKAGLGWLTGKLADHASVMCTLKPAQSAPVTIRATMGKCRVEMPDANGAMVIVETRVAIIPAGDLAGYAPRNGDRVTGEGCDCEVAAPYHGSPSWAWVDTYKTRMRVYLRDRNDDRATG